MSDTHVLTFVVVGSAGGPHPQQDLAMFFRVADADAHVAKLVEGGWAGVHIEPREMHVSEIHEAHVSLLTDEQRAVREGAK